MSTFENFLWATLLVAIVITPTVSCAPAPLAPEPIPLPEPEPLDVEGDTLYAIYRKGLITRHITKNGRLLESVALESIDDFEPEKYDNTGYIDVTRLDGSIAQRVPIDNIRYSEELIPGTHKSKPYLWVPVVAPIKNPGYSNDGYYIASGLGDNPLYYGGMALATFSLEAEYDVSDHSIEYARKLVRYFLASEMTGQNGYMVRRPGFFESNRNGYGEPIIQGASPEELIGTMLGLMYYIRAEGKIYPDNPLLSEAIALRERIIERIPIYPDFCIDITDLEIADPDDYEHTFMMSKKRPYFGISHFAFPLYASQGILLRDDDDCGPENQYLWCMDIVAGTSLSIIEDSEPVLDKIIFWKDIDTDVDYFHYVMYLNSMILVLDGDIPENEKTKYAEYFMKEFIKAAMTSGPDEDKLTNNAYFGVLAIMASSYLSDQKMEEIWKDHRIVWDNMMNAVTYQIAHPSSIGNREWSFDDERNQDNWQHNLPFWEPTIDSDDEDHVEQAQKLDTLWKNHNPHNRIGAWFVWSHKSPYRFQKSIDRWYEQFPGWTEGKSLNESNYLKSTEKKYLRSRPSHGGFLELEIADTRGHRDNQVEGAGLGLLFLRMLLTRIDQNAYPPPVLPDGYDKNFHVLPWSGVEPMHPQSLDYVNRYWSRDEHSGNGSFEIEGDQDQALRLVALGDQFYPGYNFVIAYATDGEKIRLVPGLVTDGYSYGNGEEIQPGIYLSQLRGETRGRFDKMEIAKTEDTGGNTFIVLAERAEEDGTVTTCKTDSNMRRPGRDHWLRLSLWHVTKHDEGHTGEVNRMVKWVAPEEHKSCDAAEDIDMTIIDRDYVAVVFRGEQEHHRLAIFHVNFAEPSIDLLYNEIISQNLHDHSIGIETAHKNILVSIAQDSNGWRLTSFRWDGYQLQHIGTTTSKHTNGQLLDFTIVKKRKQDYLHLDDVGGYYAIAVTKKDDYLRIHSWEVTADGILNSKGQFNTKDGEHYLIGREADWERASVVGVDWKLRPGFVIVGKGAARTVYKNGEWQKSEKGLKVIYGYIMDDGRPTIESSDVIGSKEGSGISMLDVSGIDNGDGSGIVIAHKTKDDHLLLTSWNFQDKFERLRFTSPPAAAEEAPEAPPICSDPSKPYCCRPLPQPDGNTKCMDGCASSRSDCPIPK